MTRIPAAQREPLAIAVVALQPNLPSPWLALRKGCKGCPPRPPGYYCLLRCREEMHYLQRKKEALVPGFSLAAPGRRRASFPRVLANAAALVNSGSLSLHSPLYGGESSSRLKNASIRRVFSERAATAACS